MRIFIYLFVISLAFTRCEDEKIDHSLISKRLDYYTDSYITSGSVTQSQTKVQYLYGSSGKLEKYTVLSIDPTAQAQEVLRYFTFTYTLDKVSEVKGYFPNASIPYIEYSYVYLPGGEVSKISEINHSANVTSAANFSYMIPENKINVVYTFSNGGGFEYEFTYVGQNIISDKTTKGSQLCSNGVYSYDQKINPFKALGYVDYTLTSFSANNKLTENVNYLACAFPSLIPQSYLYEYDQDGYPTQATTIYSTQNIKQVRKFFYLSN
jgi:hypothetical protein